MNGYTIQQYQVKVLFDLTLFVFIFDIYLVYLNHINSANFKTDLMDLFYNQISIFL